jgi:mannose-6-phosphate isomerase-like protein (cupin superfamily)
MLQGESMIRKITVAALFAFIAASPLAYAQQKVGSNAYIDMYFGDWHTAKSYTTHGSLREHDLLTKGDALHPTVKSAVLRYATSYSYATLAQGVTTSPTKLERKQEIYYFLSGSGRIAAGNVSLPVSENIAVLVPADLEFTIKNNGSVPLTMYLISEPVPNGFQPNARLLLRDENSTPISTTDEEWTRIVKPLFVAKDGLATLSAVSTVTLDPLTITKPHIDKSEDVEEVWTSISGTSIAMMGPFLRRQVAGMAYERPPDNLAPTANINYSENDQVKFLYFVRDHDGASEK